MPGRILKFSLLLFLSVPLFAGDRPVMDKSKGGSGDDSSQSARLETPPELAAINGVSRVRVEPLQYEPQDMQSGGPYCTNGYYYCALYIYDDGSVGEVCECIPG